MSLKSNMLAVVAFLAAAVLSACTAVQPVEPAAEPASQPVALQAMSHVAMGLPEQDVYVEREPGSEQVMRILPGEETEAADMPVYGSAAPAEHNLFGTGEAPLGPFARGEELGLTLGEWLAAGGQGTYTVTGDRAQIDMEFENLIAHGVYTVWCSRVTFPPNIEIVDKPCGAADGSQNGFTADATGRASFQLELPALPVSSPETASVIAVAYHSDGQTYGAYPGDFGLNSHVQIAAMLPVPE